MPPRVSPSPSPSRPRESPIEVLYNTAVQSFVRRDHLKTQASLSRLLELLRAKRQGPRQVWYQLDQEDEDDEWEEKVANDEWMIKTLKLVISSTVNLYNDPPRKTQSLPQVLVTLLPPKSPKEVLSYLQQRCLTSYYGTIAPPVPLLPPPLVSTLTLACLKLVPLKPSLDFAHGLCENWLAALPNSFIDFITPSPTSRRPMHKTGSTSAALEHKRLDGARERYTKVIELFVGEVLCREGEWEMAKAFLEGEGVLSSNRKEVLYKHLRKMQTKQTPPLPAPSPSSSLVLPSSDPTPDLQLPGSAKGKNRRRTGSTSSASSSSSEATARPGTLQRGLTAGTPLSKRLDKLKKDGERDAASDGSGFSRLSESTFKPSLPGTPIPAGHPVSVAGLSGVLIRVIGSLPIPQSILGRLLALSDSSPYLMSLPLPLILFLLIFLRFRRTHRSRPPASQSTISLGSRSQVQARLAQIRAGQRGWLEWAWWYLKWWVAKFGGVWKLGTTITYV
ncbi:hypothetical protein L198_00638 [Cryptococcus wingfieldii CBS 7118]|uniref:Uncharacterized protein n=1 Tax=Cryptococcus wingfieldii CBS 7118 TaxID=1295528 RepID=A0A1E3K737_9TREE|nr:hypothetical protein L198_00638 [Cryptococcus wingfieldii CBS 7118]ODO08899.1 hypothetical protein L198_00638 [Cryptococcus wingfieldii CBS 7118]